MKQVRMMDDPADKDKLTKIPLLREQLNRTPGKGDGAASAWNADDGDGYSIPQTPKLGLLATITLMLEKIVGSMGWYVLSGGTSVFLLNTFCEFKHTWVMLVLDVVTIGTFLPLGVLAGIFSAVEALLVEKRLVGVAINKSMGLIVDQEKDVQMGSDVKAFLLKLRETIAGEIFEGRGLMGGIARGLISLFSPFWDSLFNRMEVEINRIQAETADPSINFSGAWGAPGASAEQIEQRKKDNQKLSRFLEIVANGAVSGVLQDAVAAIVGTVLFIMTALEGFIVAVDYYSDYYGWP
mmetsp:Transcript_20494/g.26522  ORF Transcript_20494/g.26522 Transcript_20494/m.26522 type:complete len:295 (-) Transcript_20494:44-928(-)